MARKMKTAALMLAALAVITLTGTASAQSHAPKQTPPGRFVWLGAIYSDGVPLAFDTQTGQVCQPVVALAMSYKDAAAEMPHAKTESQKAAIFDAAVTPSCLSLYKQYPTPETK